MQDLPSSGCDAAGAAEGLEVVVGDGVFPVLAPQLPGLEPLLLQGDASTGQEPRRVEVGGSVVVAVHEDGVVGGVLEVLVQLDLQAFRGFGGFCFFSLFSLYSASIGWASR